MHPLWSLVHTCAARPAREATGQRAVQKHQTFEQAQDSAHAVLPQKGVGTISQSVDVRGELVGETGFEPATSCSQSRRATGLRYSPTARNGLAFAMVVSLVGPAGLEPAT